jgi:tRNA A-37 threonylcarbamoyl transferase component Bud32
MHQAVVRLVESASFHGYVKKREDGYMLIEEKVIADRYILLPRAVARFRSYTELECRNLFRKIALHVGKFHTAGLAHRCLHTESIVVAVGVRE